MRGSGDRATAQRLVDAAKTKPWFKLLYMGETVSDRATSRWRKEIEFDPLRTLDGVKIPALVQAPEAVEYFAILASWLTRQAIATPA